ncbi:MAG: acyltransferase, partial [Bacteroidota bacterium]
MQNSVHLKGLNGLRAIAALAVVVSHTLLFSKQFGLSKSTGVDLAGFGVSIFFSLSGFLITYLLLLEKDRFTTINIKAFYIRRILRIWPLYYFYLFLSVIMILIFHLGDLPGSLIYYIVLCANIPFIAGTELPLIGHYWSLGVEEQFYLFWPWIVKKTTRLIKVLLIFISIFLVLKIGLRLLHIKTGLLWPYLIIHVSRFECMAIGALGAVFFFKQNKI